MVLTVKAARRDVDVRGFLSKAISPPSLQAIETATSQLRLLGALDEANEATPLGRHLSGLPIDLKLAKLLVMGALFGCLSSALDVAACLGSKPIFLSPAEQRDEAKE